MDALIQPHTKHRQQYFNSLADFASSEEHLALLEIRSENSPINNDPDKILDEDWRAKLDDGLTPFLGCTVDEVYKFYKTRMRPLDHSTSLKHFTQFVFLAIDEECVTSTPRQCILCCDAPDYDEEDQEIKLKSSVCQLRRRSPIYALWRFCESPRARFMSPKTRYYSLCRR